MVDFKLVLNPPFFAKNRDILRRRCIIQTNRNKVATARQKFRCTDYDCGNDSDDEELFRPDRIQPSLKKKHIFGGLLLTLIIILIILGWYTGFFSKKSSEEALIPPNPTEELPPSISKLHVFKRAAVCADGPPCAEIGKTILEKNGTAVDAVIATMFCNGVVTMQSMGLGGGFLMTIYKKDENRAYFLNAREKAPLLAKLEMYKDDPKKSQNGPLSVAVPGELKGYWTLYKRFGTLPWKTLIQPTIELCENGYNMTDHQYNSLFKTTLHDDPNFKKWFHAADGTFKTPGTRIIPEKLCKTLRIIAENGGDDLYNGTLAKMFLEDIKEAGGIITAEDLENYEAEFMEPVTVKMENGDNLYSAPPPGSGVLLGFIMNILDGYHFNKNSLNDLNSTVVTYHRIIEAFKYAYAKRTELGDLNFINITELLSNLTSKEYAEQVRAKIMDNTTFTDPKHYGAVYYDKGDHGTAHISVLAENGDAISVTSSVNIYFGAGLTSKQTGIIYNSVMDDFSFPYFENYFGLPGSPNNEMVPEKRPLSSMSPSVIVDKNGDAKMVIGASGGTKITTSLAWTMIRSLWFGETIKEAVDAPRMHHQLYPMQIEYEYGTLQQIVDGLKALGHTVKRNSGSVVCALLRQAGKIIANADYRKGGDVFGLS